jgi:hypothetical protein
LSTADVGFRPFVAIKSSLWRSHGEDRNSQSLDSTVCGPLFNRHPGEGRDLTLSVCRAGEIPAFAGMTDKGRSGIHPKVAKKTLSYTIRLCQPSSRLFQHGNNTGRTRPTGAANRGLRKADLS